MKSKFQKIKGTYDILPPESKKWNTAISILQSLSEQFGYEEIKTPTIENIDLFNINCIAHFMFNKLYKFSCGNLVDSLPPVSSSPCAQAP